MGYQQNQNRGPPKQYFCTRCTEWGVPGREIFFQVIGTRTDGKPNNIPHDINTNNRHQHQFRSSDGVIHWGYKHPQSGQFVNLDSQYGQQQQTMVPQQQQQQQRPDAPRQIAQANYVPPQSTVLGSRTWTKECDVCRTNGVPGQYVFGYLVAHDSTRNVDTWDIFDHDMSNPQAEHRVIHVHRTLPSNTIAQSSQQPLTNTNESVKSILPESTNVDQQTTLKDELEMWTKGESEKYEKFRELRQQEVADRNKHAEQMQEHQKSIQKLLVALIRVQIITTDRIEAAIKASFRVANLADQKKLDVFERELIKQLTSERFWVKDPLVFNALSQFEKAEFAEPAPVVPQKQPKPEPEPEPQPVENIREDILEVQEDDYSPSESFPV